MKRFLALLMTVLLLVGLMVGCAKESVSQRSKYRTDDESMSSSTRPEPVLSDLEQEILDNPGGISLTLAIRDFNPRNLRDWRVKVLNDFSAKYPYVTLNYLQVTYGDFEEKVIASVNAGMPIDVMHIGVNELPEMKTNNLVRPVQKYIDMSNPDLKLRAMDAAFRYGDDYYVAASDINFAVIYYNKDIFADAGLDDPMELYNQGKWNWAAFSKVARDTTRYLNQAHGVSSGYYGYASEYSYFFLGMNNTSILKLDNSGKYVLNMDDPALTKALENFQKASFEDKWSGWTESSSPLAAFQEGRAAMYGMWTQFGFENAINGMRELLGLPLVNYGVVPLPACQNNPEGVQMVHSSGYAIGATSNAPVHAGKLIDMLVSAETAQLAAQDRGRPAAHVELYKKLAQGKLICVNTRDSGVNGGYELMAAVTNPDEPMTVALAIEKFKPVYQRQIDEANKGYR